METELLPLQSIYNFIIFCLILTPSSSIILNLFLWTVALESDFMTYWSVYSRRITISKFDIYLLMMTEKIFIVILGLLGHNRMGKTCAPKIFVFWDTLLWREYINSQSSLYLAGRLCVLSDKRENFLRFLCSQMYWASSK